MKTVLRGDQNRHVPGARSGPTKQPHWHVAVIDDDPGVRRSVSRLLRLAGFEVTTFESAEAFLASSAAFRCLILDVQLVGLTGLELYRQLEVSGRPVPAIFITSHEDYLADAASDGRRAWLRKPFEAGDLIDAIHRVVTEDAAE